MVQLYDATGNPVGPDFAQVQQNLGDYTPGEVIPLTTGGYAMAYSFAGALLPGSLVSVAAFSADGQLLATNQLSAPAGATGDLPLGGTASLYALPDGGFVAAWVDAAPFSSGPAGEVVVRAFDPSGNPAGASVDLGTVAAGSPAVQVAADGDYTVSWMSPTGRQQETFPGEGAAASAAADLSAAQTVSLAASSGWTGAAVLSNHALAVVDAQDGGYGSHVGAVQIYDASGGMTGQVSGVGYAGAGAAFAPQITALPTGGFFEVSFAGSSDYAIFDAAGQQVFAHNAYTSPNANFIPLTGGGYALADFADQALGLFDGSGANTAWIGLASSAQPVSIVSLSDGGVAFGYADSVLGYTAAGAVAFSDPLGAHMADGFASQASALAGGRLAEVWLSPDGGQYGLPTTLDFQVFGAAGASTVATLGQDLDPWHTTFAIQAHDDGSAAVLWSEGGAIFGAEYGAGGSLGAAYAAMAGDLSSTQAIQLANDTVGLVYLQGGDVWAEVFDPSTGRAVSGDLGASSGDLSMVHALALANGGIAASWQDASGVVGATMDSSGQVAAAGSLPGEFLGVDAQGHAITLHDVGGTPELQSYALANGGLFWTA